MSKPFLTYLTRCQNILQSGRFHADVCYFYGEGSSKYVPTKRFLKPTLPPGYNFDCVNADVILNRITVKDGELVLPSEVAYQLLVLPTEHTMSPVVLQKIKKLIEAGAMVLGERKPLHAPGLTNWPECDKELKTIADSMWDDDLTTGNMRVIGKGLLLRGSIANTGIETLDFEGPNKSEGFEFIHRVIDGADFYFVSNQTNRVRNGDFLFRIRDRKPELWDPVTAVCRDLPDWSVTNDGRTRIPMWFEPYQSFFVVFRKPVDALATPDEHRNFAELKHVAELSGPWTVAFDPKWGGPEKIVFDKLDDWTKRPEEGIKYYSGTAVYRKTFDLADASLLSGKRRFLDLGAVNYVARVRLNGRDLGVVWTAPWRVDITDVVKVRKNELEIEVVNTWLNRLVGDAHLPPEKRLAKTSVGYPPNEPLMPSGLLGPVTVKIEK
jgi:hypothetical protein